MKKGTRGKRAATEEGVEKVTISILKSHLALMKRIAKRDHDKNLSGAFAELIAETARLEAMDRVLAQLPPSTPEDLARVRAEQEAPLPPPPRLRQKRSSKTKSSSKKAA